MALASESVATAICVGGASLYSAVLPSLYDIRHPATPIDKGALRDGEVIATATLLTLGLTITLITADRGPLIAAFTTAGIMLAVYEWAQLYAAGVA